MKLTQRPPPRHRVRDLIAIGSSAGGTEALQALAEHLPPDLPAAVVVAQHASISSPGMLPSILARAGPLPASLAVHDEVISDGHIYVAPPDHHLTVKYGRLRVSRGPRESKWRPCVDTLFRSVAVEYSNRAIGVVLSGLMYDGTAGLRFIKRCGGLTVVQEPQDSIYSEMPRSALAGVEVDYCLSAAQIGFLLNELAGTAAPEAPPVPADLSLEASLSPQMPWRKPLLRS